MIAKYKPSQEARHSEYIWESLLSGVEQLCRHRHRPRSCSRGVSHGLTAQILLFDNPGSTNAVATFAKWSISLTPYPSCT